MIKGAVQNRWHLYQRAVNEQIDLDSLAVFIDLCVKLKERGGVLHFFGNGGSAAIASHCAIDFSKAAQITARRYSADSFITCLANDYGSENWVKDALKIHARPGDAVVLISSSGQ